MATSQHNASGVISTPLLDPGYGMSTGTAYEPHKIIAYVVNPSESNLDYKTENSLEYQRLVKIVLSLYQPYVVVKRQLPRPVYQQNKVHSPSFISANQD